MSMYWYHTSHLAVLGVAGQMYLYNIYKNIYINIYIYYIYILYIIYFVESCVALHLSRLAENGNQLLILRLDRHTNAT